MTRDDEGQLDPSESPRVVDPTPLRDATWVATLAELQPDEIASARRQVEAT